ncbi:hypothetical protein [Halocatena halophila]|uniref:hypothetical protein n=1 Tax=Halocatena halophila TaxID=2814576 RepID=UPI002ED12030
MSKNVVATPSVEQKTNITIPDRYAREIREREHIIDACPIKVFTSSINPRWSWPWKLNAANEARPSVPPSCDEMMIDPGLNNRCGPLAAAHAAAKTDADYVLGRDLPPTQCPERVSDDEVWRVSIERVANYMIEHRRLREADSVSLGTWDLAHDAEAIAPIQPPYIESLKYMAEPIKRDTPHGPMQITILDETDYIAVGGLLSFDDVTERVEKLQEVREHVGDEMKIHALAPGTGLPVIRAIRDDPALIDSLDVSTPETGPSNGRLPDKTWTQHDHNLPRGTDSTTIRAQYSGAIALQLAYMLGPYCNDPVLDQDNDQTEQQSLLDV